MSIAQVFEINCKSFYDAALFTSSPSPCSRSSTTEVTAKEIYSYIQSHMATSAGKSEWQNALNRYIEKVVNSFLSSEESESAFPPSSGRSNIELSAWWVRFLKRVLRVESSERLTMDEIMHELSVLQAL